MVAWLRVRSAIKTFLTVGLLWAQSGALLAQQTEVNQKEISENIDVISDADWDAHFWGTHDGNAETYKALCDRPRNKDYADLCQQWRVAQAADRQVEIAYWQAWASFAGIIGLVVTIGLTGATLISTNRTARRQLRSYVAVLPGNLVSQDPQKSILFEFQPIIKNTGETPAYDLWYESNADLLPFPLPPNFDFPLRPNPASSRITLGGDEAMFGIIPVPRMYVPEEVQRLTTHSDMKLYAYGRIHYVDTFGQRRFTNFCYYAIWGSAGMPFWMSTDRYNNAT